MTARTIFMEALDKDDPAERSAFLDTSCGDDVALRERVEALLSAHAGAGNFLDKLAPERIAEELNRRQSDDETQSETGAAHDAADEDLGFLTPSDKPGVLGRLGHY